MHFLSDPGSLEGWLSMKPRCPAGTPILKADICLPSAGITAGKAFSNSEWSKKQSSNSDRLSIITRVAPHFAELALEAGHLFCYCCQHDLYETISVGHPPARRCSPYLAPL